MQLDMRGPARRFAVLAGLTLGLAVAGCSSVAPIVSPAPDAGAPTDKLITGPDTPAGSNEDFIVNVGRRTYFSQGSAELDDTARATLDKQLEWLATYTGYKVKIEGFADDPGSPEANKALGLKRANAVMAYFAAKGLASSRMRVKSFGSDQSRLVRKCDDVGCRSQNRRVVTVLDTENGA